MPAGHAERVDLHAESVGSCSGLQRPARREQQAAGAGARQAEQVSQAVSQAVRREAAFNLIEHMTGR